MKALMVVFVAIGLVLGGAGCSTSDRGTTTTQKQYSCPMGHVTTDKPGKCPKCGMDLRR